MCLKAAVMNIRLRLMSVRVFLIGVVSFFILCTTLCIPRLGWSQHATTATLESEQTATDVAPVKIDNKVLFHVRGIPSYPAQKRAHTIAERIYDAAANRAISEDSVKTVPDSAYIGIFAGPVFIMYVHDADAKWEQVDKSLLAGLFSKKIGEAIHSYREQRSAPVLWNKALYAFGALLLLTAILFIFLRLIRKLHVVFENKIKVKLETVESKSYKLISSGQLWKTLNGIVRTIRILSLTIIVAIFLNYILSLFPWTNSVAAYVVNILTEPIFKIGRGILKFLPNLAFLVVIFFVVRYVLKLTKLLFNGISNGGITIRNFDPEWAMPTFKIVRLLILAFAIVIAYPYIPGSDSNAFKGISVFLGILLSLGSSSFIGNLIAGYSMTYRGAFRKGDRIKVDDMVGHVEEQKLLVTRLRSLKNEEIIIPNSVLLNSNIINYSSRAKELGLIIHTTVGIGYETPWRLVDSMLKEAADRTPGILKEPKPYVLQKSLGDFAVIYEINGYCNDVSRLIMLYTDLHKNILDVFNENNVQIMTPAYEGDPENPKMVPREQWNTPLKNFSAPPPAAPEG